jgi:hypothetical protein
MKDALWNIAIAAVLVIGLLWIVSVLGDARLAGVW